MRLDALIAEAADTPHAALQIDGRTNFRRSSTRPNNVGAKGSSGAISAASFSSRSSSANS